MTAPFNIGDHLQPKPEWVGDANAIPSGLVRALAPWGRLGAVYVEGDHRAFAADVFERAENTDVA